MKSQINTLNTSENVTKLTCLVTNLHTLSAVEAADHILLACHWCAWADQNDTELFEYILEIDLINIILNTVKIFHQNCLNEQTNAKLAATYTHESLPLAISTTWSKTQQAHHLVALATIQGLTLIFRNVRTSSFLEKLLQRYVHPVLCGPYFENSLFTMSSFANSLSSHSSYPSIIQALASPTTSLGNSLHSLVDNATCAANVTISTVLNITPSWSNHPDSLTSNVVMNGLNSTSTLPFDLKSIQTTQNNTQNLYPDFVALLRALTECLNASSLHHFYKPPTLSSNNSSTLIENKNQYTSQYLVFPLLAHAIQLLDNDEVMIRAGARTVVLSIVSISSTLTNQPPLENWLKSPHCSLTKQVNLLLIESCDRLDRLMQNRIQKLDNTIIMYQHPHAVDLCKATLDGLPSAQGDAEFSNLLSAHLDDLQFLQDLLETCMILSNDASFKHEILSEETTPGEQLCTHLMNNVISKFIVPCYLQAFDFRLRHIYLAYCLDLFAGGPLGQLLAVLTLGRRPLTFQYAEMTISSSTSIAGKLVPVPDCDLSVTLNLYRRDLFAALQNSSNFHQCFALCVLILAIRVPGSKTLSAFPASTTNFMKSSNDIYNIMGVFPARVLKPRLLLANLTLTSASRRFHHHRCRSPLFDISMRHVSTDESEEIPSNASLLAPLIRLLTRHVIHPPDSACDLACVKLALALLFEMVCVSKSDKLRRLQPVYLDGVPLDVPLSLRRGIVRLAHQTFSTDSLTLQKLFALPENTELPGLVLEPQDFLQKLLSKRATTQSQSLHEKGVLYSACIMIALWHNLIAPFPINVPLFPPLAHVDHHFGRLYQEQYAQQIQNETQVLSTMRTDVQKNDSHTLRPQPSDRDLFKRGHRRHKSFDVARKSAALSVPRALTPFALNTCREVPHALPRAISDLPITTSGFQAAVGNDQAESRKPAPLTVSSLKICVEACAQEMAGFCD